LVNIEVARFNRREADALIAFGYACVRMIFRMNLRVDHHHQMEGAELAVFRPESNAGK
jgi:hypothetical protein